MFDRVRAATESLAGDGRAETPVDEETLAELSALIPSSEHAEHGLWTTEPLTRTLPEGEETVTPPPGGPIFLLATGRQLICVEGGATVERPSFTAPVSAVTDIEHQSSLLSTSLTITMASQTISLTPEGGDAPAFVSHVEDTVDRWETVDVAIRDAREVLAGYRDAEGMFEDIWRVGKQVRSHLRTAGDAAHRSEDAVETQLARILDPIAADLADGLREEALATVADTTIDDDGAQETYQQARDVLEFARDIVAAHSAAPLAPFETSLDRVETDLERTEWHWGGTE